MTQVLNFKNLDNETIAFLTEKGKFINVSKNEIFIQPSAKNTDITFVITGLSRGYFIVKGEEKTIGFRNEGSLIASYKSIILNKPTNIYFQAIEETMLFTISYEHIKKLEINNILVLQTINKLLKQQLVSTLQRIENHITLSPKEHYLYFIRENKDFANRVPLKHLASYIGIKPESLSRIRAKIS